ncbi:hypothetical protein [uncultured Imperialibacter sp.]
MSRYCTSRRLWAFNHLVMIGADVVHDGENLSDYLLEIGAAKPWK